jgi:hypothetical protein
MCVDKPGIRRRKGSWICVGAMRHRDALLKRERLAQKRPQNNVMSLRRKYHLSAAQKLS